MLSFLGLGGSKDSGKALGYNKGKRVVPPAADTDESSSNNAYAPPSPESAISGGPADTSINDGNDSHSSPQQQGQGQEQEQGQVNDRTAFNMQQLQSGLVLEEDSLAGGTSHYSSLARQEELGEGETDPGTARSNTSTISGTTVSTAATNGGRKKKRKKKSGDTASVAAGIGVGGSAFPAISEEAETEGDLEMHGPQLKGMTMPERCKALDIWRLRGT